MSQKLNENKILDQKCQSLLHMQGIRFAGIINNIGRQIAGGYKKTITPLVDEEEHKISLEHTLEIFITKDLEESLGSIDYIITKRKKVIVITIPMKKFSLLMTVERDSNAEKFVEKALKLFNIEISS